MEGERLPFPDRSFDTVLLFEVLEHLPDPDPVIHEARRLARENVLITTPNSGGIDELRRNGLLYEHFADLDHKNFFTESSLHALLDQNFASVAIREGDGINPFLMAPFRPIRYAGALLARLHLVPPRFYFRLYAVAEI
jgi:SAM-dependent methyltransferase